MKFPRQSIIIVSLVILFFSISLILHIYPSTNYNIQYSLNDINSTINESQFEKTTTNLRHFFLHTTSLNTSIFTSQEIQHYKDVRNIYDIILLSMILSCILLLSLRIKRYELLKATKIIFLTLPLTLLLLPVFSFIFNTIFHQILFSNSFWIMHPHQISYHIFPEKFFLYSFISIIMIIEIFAGVTYYILKRITPQINTPESKKE